MACEPPNEVDGVAATADAEASSLPRGAAVERVEAKFEDGAVEIELALSVLSLMLLPLPGSPGSLLWPELLNVTLLFPNAGGLPLDEAAPIELPPRPPPLNDPVGPGGFEGVQVWFAEDEPAPPEAFEAVPFWLLDDGPAAFQLRFPGC